ncbi:hypothetical protein [Ornithinibacillus halophilus]|uniref:Uncharacterized protein n=1 Tax=Ornithinibacillus halophilus TaxID=930117 RepID=A0A1M5JZY9_9BACI|nr:hypothetical protein [Ornithinibacillus halophilus]SHG45870.1 hypothetical protein SAMN05216225_103432 [Ornithinibacillus halophilus]
MAGAVVSILLFGFLLLYSFDFTKLRQQNTTIIEQNERIISLLEEIKNK